MQKDPFKYTLLCTGFYVKALHTQNVVTITLSGCRCVWFWSLISYSAFMKKEKCVSYIILESLLEFCQYNIGNIKIISFYIFPRSQTVWPAMPPRQGMFDHLIAAQRQKKMEKPQKQRGRHGKNPEHKLCAVEAWPEPRRGQED